MTRYAKSGDLHIAYHVFGSGPEVVVVPPLVSNIEIFWDHELYRRVLEHAGRHMTVLQFDKRGLGASDRFEKSPTLEERIDDIRAVMDAAGVHRAGFLGLSEGGLMTQLFAVRHPERVTRLALMNSVVGASALDRVPALVQPSDRQFDPSKTEERLARLVETWGHDPQFMVDWMAPSQSENASFVRWAGRLQRLSATPADLARQIQSLAGLDEPPIEEISAPTLVLHVQGDRVIHVAAGRYLAERIPGARYIEAPGEDHFLWFQQNWREILDACIEHLTESDVKATSQRQFAAILFTDLVDSTAASASAGDDCWRETLDSHDRLCREVVANEQGRIVKSTGDGILATFPVPSMAVSAAASLAASLATIGLTIRAGIHAGEIELRADGDVTGTAVNLAARVEQAAQAGQILVSSTLRDLLLGSAHSFADVGEFDLKGLGQWHLYALAEGTAQIRPRASALRT
jgi:class 3 adenylate cyclase